MNQAKIIATIGPSTRDADLIAELVAAGMAVARLNAAHGNLQWHSETIDLIRQVASQVPILLDLPGAKVRTRELEHERSFKAGTG